MRYLIRGKTAVWALNLSGSENFSIAFHSASNRSEFSMRYRRVECCVAKHCCTTILLRSRHCHTSTGTGTHTQTHTLGGCDFGSWKRCWRTGLCAHTRTNLHLIVPIVAVIRPALVKLVRVNVLDWWVDVWGATRTMNAEKFHVNKIN